jgi:hypothetical protein
MRQKAPTITMSGFVSAKSLSLRHPVVGLVCQRSTRGSLDINLVISLERMSGKHLSNN